MSDESRAAAERLWERYYAAMSGDPPLKAFVQIIGDELDRLEAVIRELRWRVRIAEHDARGEP